MVDETYDFGFATPYTSDQDRILSEKKYGVKIEQIIEPSNSAYCTLRVTGSHNAILAFANGDWDGIENSAQPPVKIA